MLSREIRRKKPRPQFNLNDDEFVNLADHEIWVHELKDTWYGDADLNGEFNSNDFVQVFQAGKYEAGWVDEWGSIRNGAGWAEGDWDTTGMFDSNDFITAFQDGGYEMGPRTDVVAVPEPGGVVLLIFAFAVLTARATKGSPLTMETKTMSRIASLAALLLTCGFSLPPVGATLIDANDLRLPSYQSADGLNITHDTLTSLEWLDIDTTTNISYHAMSARFGVGELLDFRYATLAEIDTFFNHLGLPTAPLPGDYGYGGPGYELFANASSHTGITSHPTIPWDREAAGFYTPPVVHPDDGFWYHSYPYYSLWIVFNSALLQTASHYSDFASEPEALHFASTGIGNWIVRDCRSVDCVIPEPSHLGVWGLGAWAHAVARRRKRYGCQP